MSGPVTPYDGRHLIAELHGCSGLGDVALIETALAESAAAAGATLLDLRLHGFGAGQGVTGVALLAESHISIHTWPEHSYAAIDAFMCGSAEPHKVVPILRHAFKARRIAISEQMRGVV